MLVLELWGLGDLALAMPFLRTATESAQVTLLAKPHAAPLLARFAPEVELQPLTAPWTAFRGKYRLHRWPWQNLVRTLRALRANQFDLAVSARPDPRDHLVMFLAGARRRIGFPRAGSHPLLTHRQPFPPAIHRAAHWRQLAAELGWNITAAASAPAPRVSSRRVVIHPGAGQAARQWPRRRFDDLAARFRARDWDVRIIEDEAMPLAALLDALASAGIFIGNDSGPGHLAALLGVPTFTIFGPSLPEAYSPVHPRAEWITGAPCPFRPCRDYCRFSEPRCINAISADDAWSAIQAWLNRT